MITVDERKDPNCWVCHKEGSQFFCPKCSHGFHIGCALDTKEDFDQRDETFNEMCNQCSRIKRFRHLYASSQKFKSISKDKLNSLFDFLLIRGGEIGPPPNIMTTVQGVGVLNKIKRFINFDTIRSKIHGNEYECTEELLLDLRKIEHIMALNFKESHQSGEIGRYIRKVSRYFYEIDLCPHCIYNHYLTSLGSAASCPWGHKLAVAYQPRNYTLSFGILNSAGFPDLPPFFPVKIVACDFDYVYVRLFDMRKPWSSKIPLNNVKHLNNHSLKQFPTFFCNSKLMFSRQHFQNALNKLEIHLKELKQRFGNHFSLVSDRMRFWRSDDELFIDCQSDAIDESERRLSPNPSRDSRFNEAGCPENQITKTKELSESIAKNKRLLETDSTNSPKRLTRQEIQTATNLQTGVKDSTSESLPSGWLAKVAPHGRIYYIEERTNTISWIDPRIKKPGPALTFINSSTSNGIPKQLLTGQINNGQEGCQPFSIDHTRKETGLKDPPSSKPAKRSEHPSLNVTSEKILDTKSATSKTSPKHSIEARNPMITEEIRPSEEVDEAVENLPNNSTLISSDGGIVRSFSSGPSEIMESEEVDEAVENLPNHSALSSLDDDNVRSPSLSLSDQNRFEIMESEEESELHPVENRPDCQPLRVELDKITNQQKNYLGSSSDEILQYEEKGNIEVFGISRTHKKRSGSTSEELDISETKRHNKLESNERKSKKLGSQASEEQSITHGKTESTMDVKLEIKNESMVSESKFTQKIHQKVLPCSRCTILEKKIKEYEQAIVLHNIRCEALTKYCSELKKNLENPSLQFF